MIKMVDWNRFARIELKWVGISESDDERIRELVSDTGKQLSADASSPTAINYAVVYVGEGPRTEFSPDDRLAIGDFLDWMCDIEGSSLPNGYSITTIVNEYQLMRQENQGRSPSGGGGNS